MLRTILSYSVLVLIPAVSLAIAIAPYWWVRKRYNGHPEHVEGLPSENTKEVVRPASTQRGEQAHHDNIIKWTHLWLAFGVGLVGNVIWLWILLELPVELSDFLYQIELDGFILSLLIYSIFIAITPFLFFKIRYHKLQARRIVYCIILSLLIASLEVGAGIILFFIGWNRLFYAFN